MIQGKKNGQELQNWDWVSLIEPISESSTSPTHIILPEPTITLLNSLSHKDTPETPEKSVFIEHNIAEHELMSPKPNLVSLESAPRKEFQVYSRRKKQLGRSEFCPVQTQQSQESNLSPAALEQAQEKAETDVDSLVEKWTDLYSDLDRPIAEKGVHSCTQHPLHYYLTYTSLSPTYYILGSNSDSQFGPRSPPSARMENCHIRRTKSS